MEAELNAKENNSAVAKLVAKLIDNIQISVNHVHIRFEDHSSIPGHPFAAGIILEKLHLHTQHLVIFLKTYLLKTLLRQFHQTYAVPNHR